VLGLGDSVESAPQASFNFDYTADAADSELDIRHRGGDTIDASNLEIRLDSSSANIDNDPLSGTSSLEAGDSVLVEFDAEPDSGDLVNIVYTGGGDRQDIIGSFEVP
jgi:hypothetical protein